MTGIPASGEALRAAFAHLPMIGPAPLFFLQAPRTGATVLYQAIVAAFGLPYFSNFANDSLADRPELGVAALLGLPAAPEQSFSSRLGKTVGLFAPSEASAVMSVWFGGGHPSETRSADFLPGGEAEFHRVIDHARRLSARPLAIKNAWNSFRIKAILRACPDASFIWSRRDPVAAAASDYEARVAKFGTADQWSAATPRNFEELLKRPTAEHILENQYEFARAIGEGLAGVAQDRKIEVWYEDLVSDPVATLRSVHGRLSCLANVSDPDFGVFGDRHFRRESVGGNLRGEEPHASVIEAIGRHADGNPQRFGPLRASGREGR